MKKIIFALAAVLSLLSSCGSGEKKTPFEEVNVDYILKDSTIYGLCGAGSAMNTLELITDGGDTLTINLSSTRDKDMVFGGYSVGDELAVITTSDSVNALMVINKSVLLGNWIMPNPIDGSSDIGISLLKGGTAESINQSSIVYKSWRLFNGKMQITATRNDGIDMEEVFVYTIKQLTNNTLILVDEEDDVQEYNRQSFEEDEDLGIELDWGDEEDYKI